MPNTTYLRLFPAVKQFELKNGALNVGGRLFVYYEGTDDLAEIFDEDGSRLQQPAILDNDGRALGLFVDAARLYRLEVQDAFGAMQFTVSKMAPSGGGAGSALGNQYDIISSDGSITVDKYDDAGVTKFDLGIGPQSDEFLEWIKCSEEDCGSTWIPVYQSGTMETTELGIKVHAGQLYHFTNTFIVDPDGTGINYDTFQVLMYLNDQVVDTRKFDIDSSLNDAVQCEFSHDLVPSVDGFVSFKLTIPSTCEVAGEVQCHRVYSGINAVPDTCATKQWVSGNYQPLSGMSSYVPYSAVDHNIVGQVTGINGSAIVGSLDSATVSSIASSVASAYTESALSSISSWSADISSISSKADQSALAAYQPVSAMSGYATEAYVDAAVGDKLDVTASSLFLTSLPADLATTGDVASAVSGKLDNSASGEWYPRTGNPDGFLSAHQSLAGYATEQYVDSAVSSKLDTSAFASASSNFVVNSAMTSWIPYSALDYSGTAISGIGGSSLAGMGGGGADYTGIYPVNVDNTAREISVDSLPLVTDSSLTAYGSAGSSVIGVNMDIMSGKLDSSAQVVTATSTQLYAGMAYLTSVNGAPVSASRAGNAANALLAASAWYDGTGRFISALPDSAAVSSIASSYAESAVSSKLDASAASGFYTTANESGFVGSSYVDSAVSSKADNSALSSYVPYSSLEYNTASAISGINGSALAGTTYSAGDGISITNNVVSAKVDGTTIDTNASGELTVIGGGGGDGADWDAEQGEPGYIENKPVPKTLTAGTGISITENASTITIANTAPDTVASLPTNLTSAQIQAFKEALGVDETLLWSGVALDATMSELPTNFERIRIEFGTPVANTGDNIGRGCIEVSMAYVDTSNNGSIFLSTFFNGDGSNNNPYYTSGFVIGIRTLTWQTAWTAFGQVFGTTKSTGNSWFRLNKVVGIHRIASN